MTPEQAKRVLIHIRCAASALERGENTRVKASLYCALMVLSPKDRFCSICLSYHTDDITHACE